MFILEVNQELIDACGDYGLASMLNIVQKVMGIIQVVVPIIMIFSIIFILTKMVTNPDEKKYAKALKNSIAAGVIIFFIPMVVNLTMSWLDDSFSVTACWNLAEESQDMIEWYNIKGSQNNTNTRKEQPGLKNKESDYHFSE